MREEEEEIEAEEGESPEAEEEARLLAKILRPRRELLERGA